MGNGNDRARSSGIDRRSFIKGVAATVATAPLIRGNAFGKGETPPRSYRRIATEEAFVTQDLVDGWQKIVNAKPYRALSPIPGLAHIGFRKKLLDIGEGRVKDMDKNGVDVQLLSLTSPGVQIFDPDEAVDLSQSANDQLAAAIKLRPKRFAGLAAIAPNAPKAAAAELKRCVNRLGLKGAVINSHTNGKWLDDRDCWEIFDMANDLNVPIYIHPNTPPNIMIEPYLKYALETAVLGFAHETSLHCLRLIMSGLFDQYPDLKIVIGHLGETLPFILSRIDRYVTLLLKIDPRLKNVKLKMRPSDYFRRNFYITTSGIMDTTETLEFCNTLLGSERIMFAIDYPYAPSAAMVRGVDNARIDEDARQAIYHRNAESIFTI